METKPFRGVILAGGSGTRLGGLTKSTNKHLLPIYNEPMIFHAIRKMVGRGIEDILIITGGEHLGSIANVVGSGFEYGVRISYKVQDKAGGIAQALSLAEDFTKDDSFIVLLGDNIFEASLNELVDDYQGSCSIILSYEATNPERFGVAVFKPITELKEDPELDSIVEKPKDHVSNWVVTGIYVYDKRVYDIIRTLKPSGRGELEITDVNNELIRINALGYTFMEGWWTDAGTFDSLLLANNLCHDKPPRIM